MKTKTLIIGASTNPERYAYLAAAKLLENHHNIYLIGNKTGELFGQTISTQPIPFTDVDTVTLYVSARNQTGYYDYILSLNPRRVIFNPGTENPELMGLLRNANIQTLEACTLVLLSTHNF